MAEDPEPYCRAGNCHRIGVVVENFDDAISWFEATLGASLLASEEYADEDQDGSRIGILWLHSQPILVLQSTDPDGTVGRYLARNGPGLHSLAWEIDDMWTTENLLRANGFAITGTHIPGRHFFIHPKETFGLLLELTDVRIPGDPRLGGSSATPAAATVPVVKVAWVTAAVAEIDPVVEQLERIMGARVTASPAEGSATESVLDLEIGDLPVRLVAPANKLSSFWDSISGDSGRLHSLALAVTEFSKIEKYLEGAGIDIVARDAFSVWTDPRQTMGLRIQFVDASVVDA